MSDCNIPAAGNPNHFAPDEITVYGVKLNTGQAYGKIDLGGDEAPLTLQLSVASGNKTLQPGEVAVVAAYGYAYEGHCYRFDKPKILLFEYDGAGFLAQGCGFDSPAPSSSPRVQDLARPLQALQHVADQISDQDFGIGYDH